MINNDLPSHICDIMETEIFDKLLKAKNFKNEEVIRDEIKSIFDVILKPWVGKNTEGIMSKLDDYIEMGSLSSNDENF